MITGITFWLIVIMANLVVWDWARQRDWPLALVLLSFLVMQCMNRKQLF